MGRQVKLTKKQVDTTLKLISFDPNKHPILQRIYEQFNDDYLIDRCYEDMLRLKENKTSIDIQQKSEILCAGARLLLMALLKNNEAIRAETKDRPGREDTGCFNIVSKDTEMGSC